MYAKTVVLAFLLFFAASTSLAFATNLNLDESPAPAVETIRVNINQASAEQLADVLHGVGLARAQAIIELRESIGGFEHIDELLQVRGLSVRIIEMNQQRIEL